MNILKTLSTRALAFLSAALLFSTSTYAQVTDWSDDFSISDPTDVTWFLDGNYDDITSGGSYDADNGRYIISAAGGADGAPTYGRDGTGTDLATGSPVDSYVAEVTFDLINFKGGDGGADLTFQTNGTDGRMEIKLNPFGRFNLSHTDFANGAAWTINTNFAIVEAGGSIINNGDSFTIKMSYDSTDDSMTFYYKLNGGEDTLIYAATAANDSAGGYGFGDVVTGVRWDSNKKDAMYLKLYKWGSTPDSATIGVTSASLTANPIADADEDGVADDVDAHPGFDDTVLGPYLTTWLTDNNYIVDDGTGGGGGGLTQQDLLDARVGSAAVDVSNGTATITLQVEQSDDNMQTWSSPAEGATTVDIPVTGDASFFRVRAQ
jgi:hypothetical protein